MSPQPNITLSVLVVETAAALIVVVLKLKERGNVWSDHSKPPLSFSSYISEVIEPVAVPSGTLKKKKNIIPNAVDSTQPLQVAVLWKGGFCPVETSPHPCSYSELSHLQICCDLTFLQ